MQKTLVWRSQKEREKTFVRGCAEKHGERILVIGQPYSRIGDEALKNNIRIREVSLENCVREIGRESFAGCTRLRTVRSEKIKVIKNRAFSGCVNLRSFEIPATTEYIGKGVLYGCKRLQKTVFEENKKIIQIPAEAFMECQELSGVVLPEMITEIGRRAFYKCGNLTEIKIPQSVERIEREAFYQTGLQKLELPQKLKFIGESAFLKCRNLEYVRVPEYVETVEKWALHGCSMLKTVEFSGDPEVLGEWIINKGTKILCRKNTRVDDYCRKYGFAVEYL